MSDHYQNHMSWISQKIHVVESYAHSSQYLYIRNLSFQKPKCTLDTINGCEILHQVYLKADPGMLVSK